jgi:KDO2-lipid IV(A) lauroyltransferase|tara:strand:+ start:3145 stop:3996 length:852 start_codon:yes stop_codon:yes gene_type:complete
MKVIFYIFTILPLKTAFAIFNLLPKLLLAAHPSFNVTKKNLFIAFPELSETELFSLSIDSVRETLKSFYETLYVWSRSPNKIIQHTKKINNRFLFSAQENHQGLIIFALHNRSIDFMLRWISTQRIHTSLYKTIKSKQVNRFVKAFREEGGNTLTPTGIGGVKAIINALNNNQMTCMASDQVPADGLGKYSTFFGHECYSFSLAPSLAKKTNKPILMTSLSYNSALGHIMSFKKPDEKIYGEDGVDIMNREMELEIRKCPKEYSWEYKKFRKLTNKSVDIYKA